MSDSKTTALGGGGQLVTGVAYILFCHGGKGFMIVWGGDLCAKLPKLLDYCKFCVGYSKILLGENSTTTPIQPACNAAWGPPAQKVACEASIHVFEITTTDCFCSFRISLLKIRNDIPPPLKLFKYLDSHASNRFFIIRIQSDSSIELCSLNFRIL